jgi:hypothetical protein
MLKKSKSIVGSRTSSYFLSSSHMSCHFTNTCEWKKELADVQVFNTHPCHSMCQPSFLFLVGYCPPWMCTYHLSAHQLMGIFSFYEKMLWTFVGKFLHLIFGYIPIYEMLSHLASMFNFLRNYWNFFFAKSLHHLTLPQAACEVLISPHPCQHLSFWLWLS